MTGEELYWVYVQSLSEQGVGSDAWGDLDEEDRIAWRAVAEFADAEHEETLGAGDYDEMEPDA